MFSTHLSSSRRTIHWHITERKTVKTTRFMHRLSSPHMTRRLDQEQAEKQLENQ